MVYGPRFVGYGGWLANFGFFFFFFFFLLQFVDLSC